VWTELLPIKCLSVKPVSEKMQYFYGLQRINKYMHKNYGAKFVQNDKLNNKTKKVAEKH